VKFGGSIRFCFAFTGLGDLRRATKLEAFQRTVNDNDVLVRYLIVSSDNNMVTNSQPAVKL
jgi:hypothetical protein